VRQDVSFRKNDNAFLSANEPRALQKAADSLTSEIISERLDYWILIVGPKFSKRERRLMNLRRFYALSQIEYCHNFIFRQNFSIRKLFQRSCELGFFCLNRKKSIEHIRVQNHQAIQRETPDGSWTAWPCHHTLRVYFKHSFVKQYEKFCTFMRMEVCSNHTPDLHVRKSLANLHVFREKAVGILDRFAGLQANALNVHFDFPLFQLMALPITYVNTRIAGIKIHDERMIRLMETRGLIERNGRHYFYLLTDKGMKVAAMFVLFHKRLCGPLANGLFHHRPNNIHVIDGKLEKAYQKADDSIQEIVELLAA
jgi:hypothetical protein